MKKSLLFFAVLLLINFHLSERCISATSADQAPTLRVLDSADVPGKWLVLSNRNVSQPEIEHPYILKEGKMVKLAPDHAFLNAATWSPSGHKILASQPGDPISFLRIYNEEGSLLETIETNRFSIGFDWIDENRIVYSDGWTSDNEEGHVILFDLQSKEKKILCKMPYKYEASDLRVSPDKTKLIFNVNPILSARNQFMPKTILINLETLKLKEIDMIAGLAGWLPDSKSVIVLTNWQADKSKINDRFGIIARFDTETGTMRRIKDSEGFYRVATLSRDGRYIYYARSTSDGSVAAFIQSLEMPHEWQITRPSDSTITDIPTSWLPDPNKDLLPA